MFKSWVEAGLLGKWRHLSPLAGARLIRRGILHRCASTATSKIVTSPYGTLELPDCTMAECVWKNMDRWPDKTAIECGVTGKTLSYAEIRERCRIFAWRLTELGLRPGDVVNLVLPNCVQFPVVLMASFEAAITVSTINPLYTPDEMKHQLEETDSKCIVTHESVLDRVLRARSKLGRPVPVICVAGDSGRLPQVAGPTEGKLCTEEEFTNNYKPVEGRIDVKIDTGDTALLPYSSGTTGLPKGVCLTTTNLVSNVEHNKCSRLIHHLPITKEYQEASPGYLPFFHLFGLMHMICCLESGRKLVVLPRFEPKTFLRVFENHREIVLHTVPPILSFLGSHPAVKPNHLDSIRAIVTGGAPAAPADIERIYAIRKFPVVQAYGLTESSPLLTHPPNTCTDYKTVGPPVQNTEAKVIDLETGTNDLGVEQVGELCFRGPQVMKGYHKNQKATDEALDGEGWLHTGDVGYYNKEGYFFIVDRKKEMIKVKGYQVAPAELESVLKDHPKVLDAGVAGVRCSRTGEKPIAYVVPKRPTDRIELSEIMEFMSKRLAPFKIPAEIIVTDHIPKSASGKILRRQLAQIYTGDKDK